MDGDFAPMGELANFRKKHGFLLVIDDAHGTFVFGENGGGVADEFNCVNDVDICIGTLSKAAGCHGGFIACRLKVGVTLSAAHTEDDLKKLTASLSQCIDFQSIIVVSTNGYSKIVAAL